MPANHQKAIYRRFCKRSPELLPLFLRDWYLDVICGKEDWDVVLVAHEEEVRAALPYYLKKRGPFTYITMPNLGKAMGPYLHPHFRRPRQSQKLLKALVEQIPKVDYFYQSCHYDFKDWLPFYWSGYDQSTAYSYILEPLADLDQVLANFSTDYRNNKLKKAKQQVQLRHDLPLSVLFDISQKSFERQELSFPFSFDFFKHYDQVLAAHDCRKLFFAVDAQDRVHSIVYLVWDHQAAYYLLAGDDPNLRNSGAGIFLAWEAIKYSQEQLGLNRFDFLGSMIEPIERVRRQFGAKQVPYFKLEKYGSLGFRVLDWVRGKRG
ncbi:MAG: GNAT family N-acetyltransferase [Bacteroidota bacterium]